MAFPPPNTFVQKIREANQILKEEGFAHIDVDIMCVHKIVCELYDRIEAARTAPRHTISSGDPNGDFLMHLAIELYNHTDKFIDTRVSDNLLIRGDQVLNSF